MNKANKSGLLQRWKKHWQKRVGLWVLRRIPPARNVVLNKDNIFIIPNKQGLGFCFVLGLMFIGAINYEISLAFGLVFLLLAMFVLSIFYTFKNLSGLHITAVPGSSVFAGEKASIEVIVNRHGKREYESVQLAFAGSKQVVFNLIEKTEVRTMLYVPAEHRGYFAPGRLTIDTVFPFGICRAWSLIDLNFNCLVYPKPIECDLDWLLSNQQNSGNTTMIKGNDDFYGLREYIVGDSLKHVAWKIFARGQGMFTKEYSSNIDDRIWLRWDMFPDMSEEDRLSRLCYCVIKLDAAGLDYGLELPGVNIAPAKGADHYTRVLRHLALHGLEESSPAAQNNASWLRSFNQQGVTG